MMDLSQHSFPALESRSSFLLYACSKEVVRHCKPHLDELDLTYTQYIAMIVLWEKAEITSKELGRYLYLDSGTLTPLLRKLESKGYITRQRSPEDERNLIVRVTEAGLALRERAARSNQEIEQAVRLDEEETAALCKLLYKALSGLK